MEIPILGGAYTGRSVNANSEELLNMYLEKGGKGGRDALYGTPGMVSQDESASAEVRGAIRVEGYNYIAYVKGNTLFLLDPDTEELINAGTLDSSTGSVTMTSSPTQILVADGVDLYAYTISGANLSAIENLNAFATTVAGIYAPAFLTGADGLSGDVAPSGTDPRVVAFQSLSAGSFGIQIDGRAYEIIDMDFTAITLLTEVAAIIQAAIRAATGNNERVAFGGDVFIISSADESFRSSVGHCYAISPAVGFDIAGSSVSKYSVTSGGITYNSQYNFLAAQVGEGVTTPAISVSGARADDKIINVVSSEAFVVGDVININVDGDPDTDIAPQYALRTISAVAGLPAYIDSSIPHVEDDYAVWEAISDGSFRLRVEGLVYDVTGVDFTGDASMADVAATLQAALRAATTSTETVVWDTDHFRITSADETVDSDISYLSSAGAGTDISGDDYLAMTAAYGVLTNRITEGQITVTVALGDTAAIGNEVYLTSSFPEVSTCTSLDGFGIVNESDSDTIYISNLNDFFFWEELDFSEASTNADNTTRVLSSNKELWVFGGSSVLPYYNAGTSDFPFKRIVGAYIEHGCEAKHTPAIIDSNVIWLSEKRQVLMSRGHKAVPVSTPQIDYHLAQYETASDAIGYAMLWAGHWWYVLTFPSETGPSWVYDMTENEWFRWGSGGDRHRSNCHALLNGLHWIGDFENGGLYTLSEAVYTDKGALGATIDITRTIVGPNILNGRKRFGISSFELDIESGVGSGSWTFSYSEDGGHTYSNTSTLPLGATAAYSTRLVRRRLGQHRSFTSKLTTTAARELVVLGAFVNIEGEDDGQ